MTKAEKDRAYRQHRDEQARFLARNTTPAERFEWLEKTLAGLGIERLTEMNSKDRHNKRVR